MATIEFRGLSLSEAEEVLAEICNFAEEYDIPSPEMVFDFGAWSSVTLGCRFAEPLWGRLMATRMADWLAECSSRQAVIGGRGASGRALADPPLQLAAATLRATGCGNIDRSARGILALHDFSGGLPRRPGSGRRRRPQ